MKENVICGHLIPAGTGLPQYTRLVVGSRDDIEGALAADIADQMPEPENIG